VIDLNDWRAVRVLGLTALILTGLAGPAWAQTASPAPATPSSTAPAPATPPADVPAAAPPEDDATATIRMSRTRPPVRAPVRPSARDVGLSRTQAHAARHGRPAVRPPRPRARTRTAAPPHGQMVHFAFAG